MSSVIVAGAVIGGIMGGGGSLYGISKGNRQLTKAFKKRMQYAQKNYNYNQALLDRQAKSLNDQATQQLFSLSLSAYQNNSSVFAAQAQTGYQGRSAQKIQRSVKGMTQMQKTSVKDNARVAQQSIKSQKQNLYISFSNQVKAQREALSSQYTYGFNAFMQFLNSAASGAAAGAAGGALFGAAAGAAGGGAAAGAAGGGASAAGSAGVDAISGAAISAAEGAGTAGTTAITVTGGTAATTSLASTSGSSGGWLSSLPQGSFTSNLNTLISDNKGLFDSLNYFKNFVGSINSGYSRRGGYLR